MTQGFTRFRDFQVGKQSVIGTAVAATRVLPYQASIVVNPNRTEPAIDVGSLDPIIAPYATALDVTISGATGPQAFQDLPVRLAAGIMGGVTPTGPTGTTAYTWTYQAASLTADAFDYFSGQTGDDTAISGGAGINAFGGVIDQFSMTMPEDLGPWTVNDNWVFAGAVYGNRTGALTVDATPSFMFGTDTAFYLDSAAGSIGATQLLNAVRGATLTVGDNLDLKRYANGSNTRFQLGGYGRGPRTIELSLTVEKTAAVIAEMTTLTTTPTPNRYIKIACNSTELAGTAIFYKAEFFLPMRLMSVADGAIGGNTTYVLTYRGFYDATLTYAFKAVVINKLATLP